MTLPLLDRIEAETRALRVDARLDAPITVEHYVRFLGRTYGFVRPLEGAVLRTPGLLRFVDARRLRKHELIARDLDVLGVTRDGIERLPQCPAIPWFEDVREALGWAWLIEHATLAHMTLFHAVARALPGEAAFASTYLKCYFGAVGEMWRSFGDALRSAAGTPSQANQIVEAAKQGARASRRWWQHDHRRASPHEHFGS